MKLKLAALRRAKPGPKLEASGRYRVALHGFSDFERTALVFCIEHAAARDPTYVLVERAADADYIVADASHQALATSVTRGPRMRDTLFVGDHAPPGARARVGRPIDPEEILRALDAMTVAPCEAPPHGEPPDVVLPLAPGVGDFPTLSEFDIVETTPAAFEHAPVLINLADLEPIARPRARGQVQPGAPGAPGTPGTPSVPGAPAAPAQAPARAADGADPAAAEPAAAQAHEPDAADAQAAAKQATAEQAGDAQIVEPKGVESRSFAAHAPDAQPHAEAKPPRADSSVPRPAAPATGVFGAAAVAATRAGASGEPAAAEAVPGFAAGTTTRHVPSADERAEAKAAARRRSRLARLKQAAGASGQALRDVVLLDPAGEHGALAAQLGAFGFEVHVAAGSADALTLLAQMPLAAAFLDVAPGSQDDLDGLELCMEIKHARVTAAGAVPPVFLLANRDSAAGRVRAKLAGCDALLIRPVTRGDAARALEACDVALPADERRIART